jgi:hypothetical protein
MNTIYNCSFFLQEKARGMGGKGCWESMRCEVNLEFGTNFGRNTHLTAAREKFNKKLLDIIILVVYHINRYIILRNQMESRKELSRFEVKEKPEHVLLYRLPLVSPVLLSRMPSASIRCTAWSPQSEVTATICWIWTKWCS